MTNQRFKSVFEVSAANAEILANANEFFFSSQNVRSQMLLHNQSMNHLEVNNNSGSVVAVDFDGDSNRRRIVQAKGNLVVEAGDNIFFNTIKVTELDAAVIAASELRLNARIMKEVY